MAWQLDDDDQDLHHHKCPSEHAAKRSIQNNYPETRSSSQMPVLVCCVLDFNSQGLVYEIRKRARGRKGEKNGF